MKNPKVKTAGLFGPMMVLVLSAVLVSACVKKGPMLMDFRYEPPRGPAEESPKVTVGVSRFKDDRGKEESLAGRRFSSLTDETNDLVVQGTVAEKVTHSLKNSLRARDITTRNMPAWDLTDRAIPADNADVVISGEIKNLWVDVLSSFANTSVKARVELRLVVADVTDRKIIRVLNVNSGIERQNVSFSLPFVENTLSEALTAALNQMYNDEELKKKLK